MENPFENSKQRLLEGELAGFEFDAKMKKRVLEQIHSPSKVKKLNTLFPVFLSVCLIVLFFSGIYKFILFSSEDGTNAGQNTDSNVTVENKNDMMPPNKDEVDDIPQVENKNDPNQREIIEPETNSEEKKESAEIEINNEEESTYFDKEFISLAKQGYIKGLPIQVGTTVGEIKKRYGEPLEYGFGEGAYSLVYEDFKFYYPATVHYNERANVNDNVSTEAARLYLKDKLYLSDMKKGLGEPVFAGVLEFNNLFTIEYQFGNSTLVAITESGEEGVIKYIELTVWY